METNMVETETFDFANFFSENAEMQENILNSVLENAVLFGILAVIALVVGIFLYKVFFFSVLIDIGLVVSTLFVPYLLIPVYLFFGFSEPKPKTVFQKIFYTIIGAVIIGLTLLIPYASYFWSVVILFSLIGRERSRFIRRRALKYQKEYLEMQALYGNEE